MNASRRINRQTDQVQLHVAPERTDGGAMMGVWPMAILFLVAALVFSMTLSAQDEANKQAIAQQDPTPARGAYGFGLVVAVAFFVLAFLIMGSMTVVP